MTDEKYVLFQDTKEKKSVARSARNRRTHNGKGGRVRLPSDNLSKKELNAMNGKVESYRLNEPMSWKEFKAMPDDLKVDYIKLLRNKFGVPDCKIGEMMGINKAAMSQEIKRIGLGHGTKHGGYKTWDKDGFYAWVNGVRKTQQEEEIPTEIETPVEEVVEVAEDLPVETPVEIPVEIPTDSKAVPFSGSLTFDGRVEDILKTVGCLLQNAEVRLHIGWELLDYGKDMMPNG